MRRQSIFVVTSVIVLISGVACRRPNEGGAAGGASEKEHADLRKFEDDWYAASLKDSPEGATQLGEYQYNDQLSHYSPAHYADLRKESSDFLARLNAIDATGAPEMDRIDIALLKETLEDEIKGIDLKTWEMPVDQFGGVQIGLPQISSYAPFDSVKQYDDYIARLQQIPGRFDEVVEALNQGKKDGLLPPKFLLDKVVQQCKSLSGPAGIDNPFSSPLNHIPATFSAGDKQRLHDKVLEVVDGQVRPAYRKFTDFLAQQYVPSGRVNPGIWSLPNGDELYRFAVHTQTTSDLMPEQIHELGLAQVKEIQAEIDALAKKAGYADGAAFTKAALGDPRTRAKSREEILNNFRRYIDQMNLKLPQLFGLLPKAKVIVTSVPEYMEREGSTEYVPGTPDGSRHGQVWVDTYDPTHHDMLDDEDTAYHEGVPGHHMQVSISQELPGLHKVHRMLQYNAYEEGWALYAERLGKEVGFYQNPESDLGRLRSELFRAIRLVLDTGVHYKHWTRQQMVDYFVEIYGNSDPAEIQREVDRYIAFPGQALGYKLGQLKILELRERAKNELGSSFDIRTFHDEVLNGGSLPLNVLDARVTQWISQEKGKTKPGA